MQCINYAIGDTTAKHLQRRRSASKCNAFRTELFSFILQCTLFGWEKEWAIQFNGIADRLRVRTDIIFIEMLKKRYAFLKSHHTYIGQTGILFK